VAQNRADELDRAQLIRYRRQSRRVVPRTLGSLEVQVERLVLLRPVHLRDGDAPRPEFLLGQSETEAGAATQRGYRGTNSAFGRGIGVENQPFHVQAQSYVWRAFEVRRRPALAPLRPCVEALALQECGEYVGNGLQEVLIARLQATPFGRQGDDRDDLPARVVNHRGD